MNKLNIRDIRVTGLTQPVDGTFWEITATLRQDSVTELVLKLAVAPVRRKGKVLVLENFYVAEEYECDYGSSKNFAWIETPITRESVEGIMIELLRQEGFIPQEKESNDE